MQLPDDVQRSLERMKALAVVDELRRVTEMLQTNGQPLAARLVANRADVLSQSAKVATLTTPTDDVINQQRLGRIKRGASHA